LEVIEVLLDLNYADRNRYMDRRRKLLVNVGEEKVSNLLSQAVTSHLASVCPKVGLKDAVNISNSGLPDELYRFCCG
jgi:hypothetical protein